MFAGIDCWVLIAAKQNGPPPNITSHHYPLLLGHLGENTPQIGARALLKLWASVFWTILLHRRLKGAVFVAQGYMIIAQGGGEAAWDHHDGCQKHGRCLLHGRRWLGETTAPAPGEL